MMESRLGYWPYDSHESPVEWGMDGQNIWLPRGVVIPCEVAGELWYIKFRRPIGEPKFIAPRGYARALDGADQLDEHRHAVILTEGEFDALLLRQVAGDLVAACTTGSNTHRVDLSRWGVYIMRATHRYASYDADDGSAASEKNQMWAKGLTPIRPPYGPGQKDLTDYHKAGGNLRAWVQTIMTETRGDNVILPSG